MLIYIDESKHCEHHSEMKQKIEFSHCNRFFQYLAYVRWEVNGQVSVLGRHDNLSNSDIRHIVMAPDLGQR